MAAAPGSGKSGDAGGRIFPDAEAAGTGGR
jgi:hypothetical protein